MYLGWVLHRGWQTFTSGFLPLVLHLKHIAWCKHEQTQQQRTDTTTQFSHNNYHRKKLEARWIENTVNRKFIVHKSASAPLRINGGPRGPNIIIEFLCSLYAGGKELHAGFFHITIFFSCRSWACVCNYSMREIFNWFSWEMNFK